VVIKWQFRCKMLIVILISGYAHCVLSINRSILRDLRNEKRQKNFFSTQMITRINRKSRRTYKYKYKINKFHAILLNDYIVRTSLRIPVKNNSIVSKIKSFKVSKFGSIIYIYIHIYNLCNNLFTLRIS